MSIIVAYKNDNGIILAADSKAFKVDPVQGVIDLKVNRMHQLTPHTAIITGGAAEGENMCRALKDFVADENLNDIEEIHQAALPFLASEYEQFMRKTCAFWPIDPIHQVYFILGGYSPRNSQKPFQLHLFWTKMKRPQLDVDEISSVYTVPRLMRLEYSLSQSDREKMSLEDALAEIRSHLDQQAAIHDEISGPFSCVTIDRGGSRIIE